MLRVFASAITCMTPLFGSIIVRARAAIVFAPASFETFTLVRRRSSDAPRDSPFGLSRFALALLGSGMRSFLSHARSLRLSREVRDRLLDDRVRSRALAGAASTSRPNYSPVSGATHDAVGLLSSPRMCPGERPATSCPFGQVAPPRIEDSRDDLLSAIIRALTRRSFTSCFRSVSETRMLALSRRFLHPRSPFDDHVWPLVRTIRALLAFWAARTLALGCSLLQLRAFTRSNDSFVRLTFWAARPVVLVDDRRNHHFRLSRLSLCRTSVRSSFATRTVHLAMTRSSRACSSLGGLVRSRSLLRGIFSEGGAFGTRSRRLRSLLLQSSRRSRPLPSASMRSPAHRPPSGARARSSYGLSCKRPFQSLAAPYVLSSASAPPIIRCELPGVLTIARAHLVARERNLARPRGKAVSLFALASASTYEASQFPFGSRFAFARVHARFRTLRLDLDRGPRSKLSSIPCDTDAMLRAWGVRRFESPSLVLRADRTCLPFRAATHVCPSIQRDRCDLRSSPRDLFLEIALLSFRAAPLSRRRSLREAANRFWRSASSDPNPCAPAHPAPLSRNRAHELASRGFSSPPTSFEDRRGKRSLSRLRIGGHLISRLTPTRHLSRGSSWNPTCPFGQHLFFRTGVRAPSRTSLLAGGHLRGGHLLRDIRSNLSVVEVSAFDPDASHFRGSYRERSSPFGERRRTNPSC